MHQQGSSARQVLPAQTSSIRLARRLVRRETEFTSTELRYDAELLTSELVSNALVHAGTPIEVAVALGAHGVVVAVTDGSDQAPVARHYGNPASTGRGVQLLEELSDEWGVIPTAHGKTVWFRIGEGPETPAERPPRAALPRTGADVFMVELVGLPRELYVRWQEQAEALLRDFLLQQLDNGHDVEALQRHAECSNAIAVLAGALTGTGGPTGDRWFVPVPRSSVAHFATLDAVLDEALAIASAQSLAARPDAECNRLRHWLCAQVQAQARGASSSPWRRAEHGDHGGSAPAAGWWSR
jgi:anti-sigma regulatory factor (Ser/Thr protein kinase)